jgi:hypothetical protein
LALVADRYYYTPSSDVTYRQLPKLIIYVGKDTWNIATLTLWNDILTRMAAEKIWSSYVPGSAPSKNATLNGDLVVTSPPLYNSPSFPQNASPLLKYLCLCTQSPIGNSAPMKPWFSRNLRGAYIFVNQSRSRHMKCFSTNITPPHQNLIEPTKRQHLHD